MGGEARSKRATFDELVRQIEQAGENTTTLRSLGAQLHAIEKPGPLSRFSSAAIRSARDQWQHLLSEMGESREMLRLIASRVRTGAPLTDEERDKIRAQLTDLVKVVPAGVVAAATTAVPVPGAFLLTPTVLTRLGLMPSTWREAHILSRLREEQIRIRKSGLTDQAVSLAELHTSIVENAHRRDEVAQDAALLTHWDVNRNGKWDPEEKRAYLGELERVRTLVTRHRARKRWFIQHEGTIYGAMRLSEVLDDELDPTCATAQMLVCYDGSSGWIELGHLIGHEPTW
ncbi:MAG: hypothetical protein V3V08_19160 [Nannocystaceae bacterium]